jgi:hypothetical protein
MMQSCVAGSIRYTVNLEHRTAGSTWAPVSSRKVRSQKAVLNQAESETDSDAWFALFSSQPARHDDVHVGGGECGQQVGFLSF